MHKYTQMQITHPLSYIIIRYLKILFYLFFCHRASSFGAGRQRRQPVNQPNNLEKKIEYIDPTHELQTVFPIHMRIYIYILYIYAYITYILCICGMPRISCISNVCYVKCIHIHKSYSMKGHWPVPCPWLPSSLQF